MNIFAEGGLLDNHLEGYQERRGQKEMADALLQGLYGIDAPNIILAEGAVGVGKSLAYLLSALIRPDGRVNRGKIVVSTSSLTLQNQLEKKDLPFVQSLIEKELGERIGFVSLKGITNFCCLRELGKFKNILDVDYPGVYEHYYPLAGSGEKPDQIDPDAWDMITTTHDDCLKQACPHYEECYYYRRGRAAQTADVVIINHALFATHWYLMTKFGISILPSHSTLVIDECHELEQSILSFMGESLSRRTLRNISEGVPKVVSGLKEMRFVNADDARSLADHFELRVGGVIETVDWEGLENLIVQVANDNPPKRRIEKKYSTRVWLEQLDEVLECLESTMHYADDLKVPHFLISGYARRVQTLMQVLTWLQEDVEHVAIWFEEFRGQPIIKLTPVNVGDFLAPLWEGTDGLDETKFVLTSATMTVGGGFNYLKKQLGIPLERGRTLEGIFGSPFDYYNQVTHFFIPRDFNPKNDDFDEQVLYGIKKIVDNSPHEKTLILFTSYSQMNNLSPRIRLSYSNSYLVLEQDPSMSREFILRKFQETDKAILIAQAASFGTGIDIKGDKNIIIAKLSFEVPNDPIFATKEIRVEKAGGSGFFDLNVPIAALRARQQIGRGIRTIEDKAIIAIFDGRIVTSRWGRQILKSLPRMKLYKKI